MCNHRNHRNQHFLKFPTFYKIKITSYKYICIYKCFKIGDYGDYILYKPKPERIVRSNRQVITGDYR